MTDPEASELAELKRKIQEHLDYLKSWSSTGGASDHVSGIQVVRDGKVIQEWHDDRKS
jgi:hypothetical protein